MEKHLYVSARPVLFTCLVLLMLVWNTEAQFMGTGQQPGPSSLEEELIDSNPVTSPLQEIPGRPSNGSRRSKGILVSNSMLVGIIPQIPNLQWGYVWTFGGTWRMSRLTIDYTVPFRITKADVVFGEVHGRFADLIKTIQGYDQPNLQVLVGGGYRKRATKNCMVGVNGFYNTARLGGEWYSSGIVGLEFSTLTYGDGIIDANINYYGNFIRGRESILSAFRFGPGDMKAEVGYTQSFFDKNLLVRFKASRYVFEHFGNIRGYYAGGDVQSSDGLFKFEYVAGFDPYNKTYHSIGVFLTFGLQLEKLWDLGNPLTRPGSPRQRAPW